MEIQPELFAGLPDSEMDCGTEDSKSSDPENATVARDINWCEVTWKGYDRTIRTIEGEITATYPDFIVLKRWGNTNDRITIPLYSIIKMDKKPKPDMRELLKRRNEWERK